MELLKNARNIHVVICSGTTCYLMGASELFGIEKVLEESLASRINLEGSPCMNLCKGGSYGKAPFVKVNDTLISTATIPKVVEEIRRQASL
ncbi:MAG: NAD(P)H-dependent oxidoreductase subunit E [Spirochaetes bacterium]|nr:NAD(P)H-dependent oxidoreductase subunit E [Spirochaetota bacterium]